MRHINIWYFFVKDRVNTGKVAIEHFHTDNMWGVGFFAKPLQGRKFKRFRSVTLGKSRANEISPSRSILEPKDGSRSD